MFCKLLKILVYEFFKVFCLVVKKFESICFEDKKYCINFLLLKNIKLLKL